MRRNPPETVPLSNARASSVAAKLLLVTLLVGGGLAGVYAIAGGQSEGDPAYVTGPTPAPIRPGTGAAPPLQTADVSPFDGSMSSDPELENVTRIERRVLAYVNAERVSHGREAWFWNGNLGLIARHYSRELVQRPFQGHIEPNGSGPRHRLERRGYSCKKGGENLAQAAYGEEFQTLDGSYGWTNYTTPDELAHGITRDWMQSPSHRQLLLSPDFTVAGVGIYVDADNQVQATLLVCHRPELDQATDANATALAASEGVVEDECRLPTAYPGTTPVVDCERSETPTART